MDIELQLEMQRSPEGKQGYVRPYYYYDTF